MIETVLQRWQAEKAQMRAEDAAAEKQRQEQNALWAALLASGGEPESLKSIFSSFKDDSSTWSNAAYYKSLEKEMTADAVRADFSNMTLNELRNFKDYPGVSSLISRREQQIVWFKNQVQEQIQTA